MDSPLSLIEFPADDPDRARRFWAELLGVELTDRGDAEGRGWQTHTGGPAVGIHERGTGPGDTVSLPYFTIADMDAALGQVKALGGSVIHPGSRWAICRDSEGSPFGLSIGPQPSLPRAGRVTGVGARGFVGEPLPLLERARDEARSENLRLNA